MTVSSPDVERVLAALERGAAETRGFSFLIEAVKDIQGTIRAIDTKVGILLAVLAIPLPIVQTSLRDFHSHGAALTPTNVFGGFAFLAWVIAALVAIRALTGVGNASKHVRAEAPPDDLFYAGGQFRLRWIDAVVTRDAPLSTRSIEEFAAAVPMAAETVNLHLSFEVLSLAYIRDLKIYRQKIAFELTAFTVVLGFFSLVFSR
jgi:hypothetical protein